MKVLLKVSGNLLANNVWVHSQGITHFEGNITNLGGVTCYVATPTGEYAKEKVLLFLPDVFGLQFINNQVQPSSLSRFKKLSSN
jgi:hypothetical protein